LFCACLVFAGTVSVAAASIIGTSGDFLVTPSAAASYIANAYNDPTPAPIRIWAEQENISLASNVLLDTDLADPTLRYVIGGAGAGETAFAAGSGPTIPAGTLVNVYYAYFDPVNDNARGTVTFDQPVLGIVAHTGRLQFSDFLRVAGAPYPGNPAFANRGWEDAEWGQLSADRLTLEFFASASSPGDQFRIITAAAVPEPSTCLLLGAGLASLGLLRRRRA
jgi:hypothetical protein